MQVLLSCARDLIDELTSDDIESKNWYPAIRSLAAVHDSLTQYAFRREVIQELKEIRLTLGARNLS
jgi:hypothetical protein